MHLKGTLCVAVLIVMPTIGAHADSLVGRASLVDGDTLEISNQRVRLHGVDAPESGQECRQGGQIIRCGQQVALKLADKIGQQTVSCEQKGKDRYGRVLGVCHLGTIDLNGWLVSEGLALAYRQYSLDYVAQEEEAKQQKRFLWGMEFTAPWDWRRGERLPASSSSALNRPKPAKGFVDKDCGDFSSQAEAQAFFEVAGAGDPHKLDRDRNGVACESNR